MKLALYLFVFFASLIVAVIAAFMAFGAVMLGTFVLIPAIDFYIPAVILALFVFVIVMLLGSQKLLKRFDNHLDNLQNRQFDIAFSLTILAPFFLIGCVCSTWFFLMLSSVEENNFPTPPPPDTLSTFNKNELDCMRKIVPLEDILYLKRQESDTVIAIGYTIVDQSYAALIMTDESEECLVEFHEKVWACNENVNDNFEDMFCGENMNELEFKKIQMIELTGESPPELYIWLFTDNNGGNYDEYHVFYSQQDENKYEILYERNLCRGRSAIEINKSLQLLYITDDLACEAFLDAKIHTTISLKDGVPVTISSFKEE